MEYELHDYLRADSRYVECKAALRGVTGEAPPVLNGDIDLDADRELVGFAIGPSISRPCLSLTATRHGRWF